MRGARLGREELNQFIRGEARQALEARQVGSRLRALLPERLDSAMRAKAGRTARMRRDLALIDATYVESLVELALVTGQGLESRIEYETHMMLLDARRSLAAARRRRGK